MNSDEDLIRRANELALFFSAQRRRQRMQPRQLRIAGAGHKLDVVAQGHAVIGRVDGEENIPEHPHERFSWLKGRARFGAITNPYPLELFKPRQIHMPRSIKLPEIRTPGKDHRGSIRLPRDLEPLIRKAFGSPNDHACKERSYGRVNLPG